jgi:hypothetical protein
MLDVNFLHMDINGYHGNRNCSTNDNFCLKIFCPQRHLKIILMPIVVKINNFIAEILKINNLTPDELPESKEFNRNFENRQIL